LTANAFAEDGEVYLEPGLDDYLAKPFRDPIWQLCLPGAGEAPMRKGKSAASPPDAQPNARRSCALSPDCHIEFELVC
jgi:hypothetical protein